MSLSPLTIHAYSWRLKEIDGRVNVLAWSLDEQSRSHLVRIPYFYVCYLELKPLVLARTRVLWKHSFADDFIAKIRCDLGEFIPERVEFLWKRKLYYYQGDKTHPFLKFTFSSLEGVKKLRKLTARPVKFSAKNSKSFLNLCASTTLHEDRHSPVRRLLTARDCRYAQWFSIEVESAEEKISSIQEWVGNYKTLHPLSNITTITKPKIFSFDIECYSSNHKGFPKEYIYEHVVYMISCILFRRGEKERESYLIVLSPQEDLSLEGVEVINTRTEKELCQAFSNLIRKTDPDILTGFNIFGFDYPYLYPRLPMYGQAWENIARLEDYENVLQEINWKSSAYSRQHYYMMEAEGRVNFDLFTLARREMKLLKYNLDTVAKNFLKRGKHDVSPVEMFTIYEKFSAHPQKYKEEFLRVARYCLEDSLLVVDLIEHLNVWIWLVEFSSVTGVSVEDLFIRGQQVRCYSLLQDLAIKQDIVIDKVVIPRDKYSGAYVSDPTPGLYEFVVCLDFNSLYPNIMRAYNMCYTTLIRPEEEKEIPEEDKHVVTWEEEGKVFRHCFIRKEKREGLLPQLLGELISKRKEVRASIRGDKDPLSLSVKDKKQLGLKVVANSSYGFTGARQGFLPCPQIAESVTAKGRELILECNRYLEEKGFPCVYNDTDSVFFIIKPEEEGTLEEKYKEVLRRGKELEKELSSIFPDVLNLEMEKVGRAFYIKMKMYSFWAVNQEGVFVDPSSILHKGTSLSRRDNCLWQRNFFSSVLMHCLEKRSLEETFSLICEEVIQLYSRKYSWQDFVIVKGLGEEYKEETNAMNMFSQRMSDRGCPLLPGDRVDFIIAAGISCPIYEEGKIVGYSMKEGEADYLGEKMVSPEHFITDGAVVDYDYYLVHYGTKNVETLFNIAHREKLAEEDMKHMEGCARRALDRFLTISPKYRHLLPEKDSWQECLGEFLEILRVRRGGKTKLEKFFREEKKRLTSRLCAHPVKQQFKLIQEKKKVLSELLSIYGC